MEWNLVEYDYFKTYNFKMWIVFFVFFAPPHFCVIIPDPPHFCTIFPDPPHFCVIIPDPPHFCPPKMQKKQQQQPTNGVRWSRWIDGMQCRGVQWNGVDGMQCSGVEWNGSMECNAVEWNGMDAFWSFWVLWRTFGHFCSFVGQQQKKVKMSGSFQRSVSD